MITYARSNKEKTRKRILNKKGAGKVLRAWRKAKAKAKKGIGDYYRRWRQFLGCGQGKEAYCEESRIQ